MGFFTDKVAVRNVPVLLEPFLLCFVYYRSTNTPYLFAYLLEDEE
jgi:hypothetical protein